ncbi:MAG: tetratricopeptide repeat protein [Planctomycetes bacterium]|nr:tetratricopeptide repeat protein [Planctomycetota bacterium]
MRHTQMDSEFESIALQELSGLRLLEPIGPWAFGEDWLGTLNGVEGKVTVRLLSTAAMNDPAMVLAFQRAMSRMLQLYSSRIRRVLSVDSRPSALGRLRFALLAPALPDRLDDLQRESEFATALASVLKAIDYARRKGISHGALKREQIQISRDRSRVQVADFGVAQMREILARDPNFDEHTLEHFSPFPPIEIGSVYHAKTDLLAFHGVLREIVESNPAFEELREILKACEEDEGCHIPDFIERLGTLAASDPASISVELDTGNVSSLWHPDPKRQRLVGRGSELHQTLSALRERNKSLVTLHGPSGIGTTRLLQEVGADFRRERSFDVAFANLRAASNPLDIALSIAKALGLSTIKSDPIEQVALSLSLREAPLVVLLDDVRCSAADANETFHTWIEAAPEVRFVLTRREPLGVHYEEAIEVARLGYEDNREMEAGIELFVDLARVAYPPFELNDGNRDAVQEIVRRAKGMPRILELAASRIRTMSPHSLLERMPKHDDHEAGMKSEASAAMQAAMDWTWGLLKPHERAALSQASVFREGFFLDAAHAVIDLSAFADAPPVHEVIEYLVERALLRSSGTQPPLGETLYVLPDATREFVEERIDDPVLIDSARWRHARFYVQFARRWSERVGTIAATEALERVQREQNNMQAAIEHSISDKPAIAGNLILSLTRMLEIRGPIAMATEYLEQGIAALPQTPTPLLAFLHLQHSRVSWHQANQDLASSECERAISIGESLVDQDPSVGHRLVLAISILGRGMQLAQSGKPLLARDLLSRVLATVEGLNEDRAVAMVCGVLAVAESRLGNFEASVEQYRRAIEVSQRVGNLRSWAAAAGNLGVAIASNHEFQRAIEFYDLSESLYNQLGDLSGVCMNIVNRGIAQSNLQEFEEARRSFTKAITIQRQLGDRHNAIISLGNRGESALRRGDLDSAEKDLNAAEDLSRQSRNDRVLGYWLYAKALVGYHRHFGAASRPELAKAKDAIDESLAIRREVESGPTRVVFITLATAAKVYHELGKLDGDDLLLQKATELALEAKAISDQVPAWQVDIESDGAKKPALWIREVLADA